MCKKNVLKRWKKMSKGFKEYKYGAWKKEIRDLLRKRLQLRDRIRYHKKKLGHHQERIKVIEADTLFKVEKELERYLKKAGN